MEVAVKITGLKEATRAMQAAFPKDAKKQAGLLNSAMRTAGKNTILASAKRRALQGDGSGALSESLGFRATAVRVRTARQVAASVYIAPIRFNRKAMMMYINHYYTKRGKIPSAWLIGSGIRHGHLAEFGSKNNAARPFLWPAGQSQQGAYVGRVAGDLRKKIAAAVRRKAKKRVKK